MKDNLDTILLYFSKFYKGFHILIKNKLSIFLKKLLRNFFFFLCKFIFTLTTLRFFLVKHTFHTHTDSFF
jgi:hypothetical protein